MQKLNSPRVYGLVFLFGCVCLTGCRSHDSGPPKDAALVRLINAVPDTDSVSFSVGRVRVWEHAAYRSNSGYQPVSEGRYQLAMSGDQRGGASLLSPRPMGFERNKTYTVLAYGLSGYGGTAPAATEVFEDERDSEIPPGKSRLRFINASPGLGPIDVLFDNIVGLTSIEYGKRSAPILLETSHAYAVKIIPAGGDTDALVGPVTIPVEPGHSYTLVVMGQPHVRDLSIEKYLDE